MTDFSLNFRTILEAYIHQKQASCSDIFFVSNRLGGKTLDFGPKFNKYPMLTYHNSSERKSKPSNLIALLKLGCTTICACLSTRFSSGSL